MVIAVVLSDRTVFKMVKFIIAGKSDCPFYARAELLADQLSSSLPDFTVDKIVIKPDKWDIWLAKTCKEKDWNHEGGSPLIWREFLNRGARGALVGGCNEFLEIIKGYYGVTCMKTSAEILSVAAENKITNENDEILKRQNQEKHCAFNISIVDFEKSASTTIYNLIPIIFSMQDTFHNVCLKFFSPSLVLEESNLNGIIMEVEDSAFTNFNGAINCEDFQSVLHDSQIIVVNVDEQTLNCKENLLNLKMLSEHLINMSPDIKVLVYGESALKAMFFIHSFAKGLKNLYGSTRYEENVLKGAIAKKLNVKSHQISDVVVWGATGHFIIDLTSAIVKGYDGAIWGPHINKYNHTVSKVLYDENWILEELPDLLNASSKNCLSKAAAVASQLKEIINPLSKGIYSLGCISEGWYDVPIGVPFSFPVCYDNKEISVNSDISLSEDFRLKIKATAEAFHNECLMLLQSI